jgi:glycosyltransferase involved in cell wall biosynthesis
LKTAGSDPEAANIPSSVPGSGIQKINIGGTETVRRVLAVTQLAEEACTRYRVSQYQPYLEANGYLLEACPWPRNNRDQIRLLGSVDHRDVVVVQRRLPRLPAIRELRKRARRLIFDFDDAIIYADSAQGRPWLLLDKWVRFRALVKRADAVTAGNPYLAAMASRYADTDKVFVVPTSVRVQELQAHPRNCDSKPLLAWIGSHSTLPYLEGLRDALHEVNRQYPGICVRVIADRRPDLGDILVDWKPWSPETEISELQDAHIGLAPLPDDRWTRGKCGLRLLQYLALGIPAVASPVGTQAEIVRIDGALGARSQEEWVSSILALIRDKPLADRYGAKGYACVKRDFNVASWVRMVEQIWCDAADERNISKYRKVPSSSV